MLVVLFDGVCNLCNGSVNWIIDHDKKNQFQFASLQSAFGNKKVAEIGLADDYMDTVVLLKEDEVFTHSDAILQIAKHLGGIYSLTVIFFIVPKFIRNYFYKVIAGNRYKWFGKRDSCRMPTPELKSKFIE